MQKCLEGKRRHGGECRKVSSGIIGHLLQPGLRHRRAERTGAGGQTRTASGICFSCPKGVILVHVAHAACVRGTDAGIAGAPSPRHPDLPLCFSNLLANSAGSHCSLSTLRLARVAHFNLADVPRKKVLMNIF